jgi:transposase
LFFSITQYPYFWVSGKQGAVHFAPVSEDLDEVIDASFLSVEISDGGVPIDGRAQGQPPSSLCATRVDLTLSDGRRVLVEGPTALSAVVGLVEGLIA